MKHVFTLLAFALMSSGLAQSDTVSIQTEWIEQFSNGYSAYFEDIAVVEDDLIVCGQWFQGIQANQLVVSVNENDGSLNWDHFRDCCSDHARYHEPHMIDGQLHCFGTQNGQGSSYFDAMFVRYDAASGAELDYTIWNVGGSNSFADVLIAEDSFLMLANGQGAQPLARFEDGAISTSTTIPYPNSIGRSIALLEHAGGIYSVGAGEGDNLPGLVKYSENLEVEWSQTIGDVGLRTVRNAFATPEGFTLIGEDLNVQSGFVMKVNLEGAVTQYQTFPPYLHASSRVGSIAVVDGAYVVTLIDFGPQNQTTWLLALNNNLEVVGQHQLAPNLSFSSLTGNMVADGQSVYISGFDSQVLGTESAGGQRTPTLIKVVVDLFVIPGCTDPEACNYEPTATDDDGSCLDCTLFADRCGEGTVWDDESLTCVVANPSDTDFDGCVSMTDLLDLLTVFGTCPETEAESEPLEWSCGDPLGYQGYDYETVQIGEQCWFAENCRYLPAVSPPSAGSEIDGNSHAYVFGYEGQDVDVAKALENYQSYGVLYNRVAMQTWDVCPAGWHVPTDSNFSGQGEFHELIAQFAEAEVATELKSDLSSSPGWNGSNNSGFAALPAGYRRVHSSGGYGFFSSLGDETQYWAVETWSRRLTTINPDLSFMGTSEHWGLSVRCIQDSE